MNPSYRITTNFKPLPKRPQGVTRMKHLKATEAEYQRRVALKEANRLATEEALGFDPKVKAKAWSKKAVKGAAIQKKQTGRPLWATSN